MLFNILFVLWTNLLLKIPSLEWLDLDIFCKVRVKFKLFTIFEFGDVLHIKNLLFSLFLLLILGSLWIFIILEVRKE